MKEKNALLKKLPSSGAVYGIILFVIIFSMMIPGYLTIHNISNIARQSAVLCFISMCSCLAILTNQTDLSCGAISGFAACVAAKAMNSGCSILVGCLIGLLMAMVIGAINGILAGYTEIPTFIITLATMNIAESLGMVLQGGTIHIPYDNFKNLSEGSILYIPIPALLVAALYLIMNYILKHRRYGTYLYAVGGKEAAAWTSGINVKRMKLSVYLINSALAACAGFIYAARLSAANPSQGNGLELNGICAAVLGGIVLGGGRGNVFGALLGAIAISILRNGMNMLGWRILTQMMVIGFILIVILALDVAKKGAK